MFTIEQKIIERVLKYKITIMFILITLLGAYVRFCLFPFKSYDFNTFLNPWYNQIKSQGGFVALKNQIGNYGITYQFLISIFTYLPGKSLFWYKSLSVFFDFVLAITASRIVCYLRKDNSKKLFVFTYSVLLFIPTIIMNSGMWGQCDSIYTTFLLLCFLSLLRNKNKRAFIYLGIAFAFKLQTIFFVPFILLYYLTNKKFSILNFILSLISFYICCLPGIFMGRNLLAPFKIYFIQTKETRINLNIPNFSGLLSTSSLMNFKNYEMMKLFLICITIVVLLIAYFFILLSKQTLKNFDMLNIATWTCWTCVMFLPSMHDRYMYVVDVLLLLLTMYKIKRYSFNLMIALFLSYMTYLHALLNVNINIDLLSILALFNYFLFSGIVFLDKQHSNFNISSNR